MLKSYAKFEKELKLDSHAFKDDIGHDRDTNQLFRGQLNCSIDISLETSSSPYCVALKGHIIY